MQQTIKSEVWLEGIGLHTGEKSIVCFRPASVNHKIVFVREDLPDRLSIPADLSYVSSSQRGVNLKRDETEIKTVEHILAALSGLRIDNLEIAVWGPELPAGDGSSLPFVNALKHGIVQQDKERETIRINQPVWASDGENQVVALPDSNFRVSYTISYNHPVVRAQFASLLIDESTFEHEIAPARTYGFLSEINSLRQQGLGRGGSLENALVITDEGYLNSNLRFDNELVRHKMLDLIGDLCLLGKPILGHIIAIKSSHYLNLQLAANINLKSTSED